MIIHHRIKKTDDGLLVYVKSAPEYGLRFAAVKLDAIVSIESNDDGSCVTFILENDQRFDVWCRPEDIIPIVLNEENDISWEQVIGDVEQGN